MQTGLRLFLGLWMTVWAVLLNAAPVEIVLAQIYHDRIDPADYWVSEKLDGVRAVWDGEALYFRSGRPINPPGWFVAGFPKIPMDGELWLGRGRFEQLSGVVRSQPPDETAWRLVQYRLFELPGAAGSFTERIARMQEIAAQTAVSWLQPIDQFRVKSRTELRWHLAEIVRDGGEGLMLHRADASYESGRSDVLLKLKPWLDAEAVVLAHRPGRGKHMGRLGALRVRTPEGAEFEIGTGFSDAQRKNPPPVGSTITYRYTSLTAAGVPRFARFLRLRPEE